MKRSAVRKVIRAAALSLLLVTASGVAGLEMIGAGPAMAAQQDSPGGDAQGTGTGSEQPDPAANQNPPAASNPSNPDPGGTGGLVPQGLVPGGLLG